MGAPFGRPDGRLYAGEIFVISGASADGETSLSALVAGEGEGLAVLGEQGADQWEADPYEGDGDLVGFTVAAGHDLDGDGLTDVAGGAPNAGGGDEGRVVVIHGSDTRSPVEVGELDGGEDDGGQLLEGYTPAWSLVPGEFGWVLASLGDSDGDGYGDLAVQPQPFGGEFGTLIVPGADRRADVDLADRERVDRVEHGDFSFSCFMDTSCALTGRFLEGYALGGGDVDGDGRSDLLLRGVAEDAVADAWVGLGGALDGLDLDDVAAGLATGAYELAGDSDGSEPWADNAAIVGDLDGDGRDEIVLSSPSDGAGVVWVAFGAAPAAVDLDTLEADGRGFRIEGLSEGEELGFSVAAGGDLNGDGFGDLVLGAPAYEDGRGRVAVVLGGDYAGALAGVGGEGDDAFTGTEADESWVTGRGDDRVDGGGGEDAIATGPGADEVVLRDLEARRVDCGSGYDSVVLRGIGDLDSADLRPILRGVEHIELEGGEFGLWRVDVANLSPSSNSLVLDGSGVVVAEDGDWSWEGSWTTEDGSVDRYRDGELSLWIDGDLSVDFPPALDPASFEVDEDAAVGTWIGTLTAADPDGAVVGWTLAEGSPFAVDASGTLTVAAALDHEDTEVWTLTVEAEDDSGRSASAELTVTVADVPEAPIFAAESWSLAVDEGSAEGTVLGTVHAADPDEGDTVSAYGLSPDGSTVASDSGPFSIDDDGTIRVGDPTDLDHESFPSWTLWVVATDGSGLRSFAPLEVAVGDVDRFRNEVTVAFSTADRSIWDDDGSTPFDFYNPSQLFELPADEPVVTDLSYPGGSAELSFGLGGDFQVDLETELDFGSISASLPVALSFEVPDKLRIGEAFALSSSWRLDESALLWGAAPGWSFTGALQATDLTLDASICFDDDDCEVLDSQSYSMDEPVEVVYSGGYGDFSGSWLDDAHVATTATVETTLVDQSIDWDSYLANFLEYLGLPSTEGSWDSGDHDAVLAMEIEYVWWTSAVEIEEILASNFELEVQAVDASFRLEDGTELELRLGDSASLTLPDGADVDGDGQVSYTLSLSPVVQLRHWGSVTSAGGMSLTAGYFQADVYSFGEVVAERELGPLLSEEAVLAVETDFDLSFTLDGFGDQDIRGVFDLEWLSA